jgi:hypothetical protein
LESLEPKQTPTAGVSTHAIAAAGPVRPTSPVEVRAEGLDALRRAAAIAQAARVHAGAGAKTDGIVTAKADRPHHGYLVYRITNPNRFNNHFNPPFGHVYAGIRPPVPGQTYNILLVTVRNGTAQTFTAANGFRVKFPDGHWVPILAPGQEWKPGQNYTFYVLTKKYYPVKNQVTSGFIFDLNAISTAIPGPSGIFLRVKFDPATINKVLDYAVTRGPGIQGGAGHFTGMADTAIYEFNSAITPRNDYGGYF